jgi:dUTP pyrophosphatase
LAENGLIVTNGIGTIDSDYRGPVSVLLTNIGKEIMKIKHKDRIAQMTLKPVWYFVWQETDTLDETERNTGGFGSTG